MEARSLAFRPQRRPVLYFPVSIKLMSLLFSPIAGGLLAFRNLRAIGKPAAAHKALWGSIAYTVLLTVISGLSSNQLVRTLFPVAINLTGAYGLVAYSRRFISGWNTFPAKNSSKPMLAGVLAIGLLLALLVFLTKSAQS